MPPVSPQGSRGGLITAVVIFTIGFVTSTIFAIYYGVALSKAEDEVKKINDKSHIYYSDVSSARIQELEDERKNNPNLKDKTVLGAAIQKIDDSVRKIVGDPIPTTRPADVAVDAATSAIADAKTKLNGLVQLPDNASLVTALSTITQFAATQAQLANELKDQQNGAAGDAAKRITDAEVTAKKAQEDNADLTKKLQAVQDQMAADHTTYETKSVELSTDFDKERQANNASLHKADLRAQDQDQIIEAKNKMINTLQLKIAAKRPDVVDPIMRQPDGQILTVASDKIVYINLGKGDHIIAGTTFEVYNKAEGLPALGDGMSEDTMPVGEASIEVQQVNATSSQCRVVKLEAGQHIGEGDLIANLVYDRNTKYNFVVYGQFDFTGDKHPNERDTNTVRGLVVRWGGKLMNDITIDTDFVVMGVEPKVEDFDANALQDAFTKKRYDDEVAAQKAYSDMLTKAKDLHIPIMNQNRFLYFVGYYDIRDRY